MKIIDSLDFIGKIVCECILGLFCLLSGYSAIINFLYGSIILGIFSILSFAVVVWVIFNLVDCHTPLNLYSGKYLKLMNRDGWDYVERTNTDRVAFIVPLLEDEVGDKHIIFIKEFRIPLQKYVISCPAGLIGDNGGEETIMAGAARELLEETGYKGCLIPLTRGPSSAGLSNEIIDFFLAVGLRKVEDAKGDGTEDIEVFKIPVCEAYSWLAEQSWEPNILIDSKVYLGLYFVSKCIGKVL
ncbi:MAG: NUDIX hydrolase [Patescibacteria group bacterium]